MTSGYEDRLGLLKLKLGQLENLAVAFSGGVDSSALLHAAHSVLGDRAVGVIADSPSLPRKELEIARRVALAIGARLEVIETNELEDERYTRNAGDRCYFCKAALFETMEAWARKAGFGALAFGEITDDALDDRPGARAAVEFGVVAPLSAAGFGKEDVRRYAREAGLEVADKPASACLASRLPTGTRVTRERLARVERCEDNLRELGLKQLRVRDHGSKARVEVGGEELALAKTVWSEVERLLASEGFSQTELAEYGAPSGPHRALTS